MSLIIEITSQELNVKSGTSNRTGKPYHIREQTAYLHKKGQAYPDKFVISLESDQAPFPPGNYDLIPESFYIDRFSQLAVRPKLVPRPAENKQPSPAQAKAS